MLKKEEKRLLAIETIWLIEYINDGFVQNKEDNRRYFPLGFYIFIYKLKLKYIYIKLLDYYSIHAVQNLKFQIQNWQSIITTIYTK